MQENNITQAQTLSMAVLPFETALTRLTENGVASYSFLVDIIIIFSSPKNLDSMPIVRADSTIETNASKPACYELSI